MTASTPSEVVTRVRLVGLPVRLYAAARERQEGLLRELALLRLEGAGGVAHELLEAGEELRRRYGSVTAPVQARLDAAIEAGETDLDLEYELPTETAAASGEYARLLDEMDEHCRDGELLTLEPDDDVVAFRRWLLRELAAQARGAAPTSWTG